MLTLKCTKKVQTLFGVKRADLSEAQEEDSVFGAWYVNEFNIGRSRSLIFMSERTLLSFILFDVKKVKCHKERLPELCVRGLIQLLLLEGTPDAQMRRVIDECIPSRYANTTSKSVLGNLSELMWHYEDSILEDGGFERCNLNEILCQINRIPQRNIGWNKAIDVTRDWLHIHTV